VEERKGVGSSGFKTMEQIKEEAKMNIE